jgi:hypothetical protein
MTCPVVIAIGEIYGGGLYSMDESNVVTIGGSDGQECIMDNSYYYITQKKLELARFELSRPKDEQCYNKLMDMFGDLRGINFHDLYKLLIRKTLKNNYMYKQFTQLISLIRDMEKYIITRISVAQKFKKPINVTIPSIKFPAYIDKIILYDPHALTIAINSIVDYIINLNINSLLTEPIKDKIKPMNEFATDKQLPNLNFATPNEFDHMPAAECIDYMHKLLDKQTIVIEYINEIEKYHCSVINHVNVIFDRCKKIINSFILNLTRI